MTAQREASQNGVAAFFDVDGTIIDTTIVHYFVYFQRKRLSTYAYWTWFPWFMAKCGFYFVLDKFHRGILNKLFYRNYRSIPVTPIKGAAADCLDTIAEAAWLGGARQEIARHRNADAKIVLVTGSLDFLMEPLAGKLGGADVLAATLEERDGAFTGRLVGGPVIGEEKRRRMIEYATGRGINLSRCHAYGDSSADLPMLEAVGFPHAVNPDRRLAAIARRRGWPIHNWPVARVNDS